MNRRIVDIVIPTYKPDGKIEELLKRLGRQSYPIRHIHVINTESDRFPKELEDIPGIVITHIEANEFDHGKTRDDGLRQSDADIVIFMTQDAIPADTHLIEELLRPFSDDKVAVTYARQLPDKTCGKIECYTRSFNYPDESRVKTKEDIGELGIKTFFCSNVCAAYRRTSYKELGGFIRHTIFNEDMILAAHAILAGYKVAYCAQARVIHSHNYTGVQQFHRNFDLAVSQADNPEVFAEIRSESEGIRLVKRTALHLIKTKNIHLLPVLAYQSACKYIGYKMGYHYGQIPLWLVKKCSMNTKYWENGANN